jgi:hypothetical protein
MISYFNLNVEEEFSGNGKLCITVEGGGRLKVLESNSFDKYTLDNSTN